ncbi:type IV pilus assembly protein PilZ [Treponema primitia ZAS-2]|uniref:Type IV pilus assembly protein PilZ n=1 Tax=Treponema primitia (strain ATCC BAA-887 / DSM 12427 / ZAS-2) TaxID=545694 RepID=F5YPS4_TREPZ|nr:PilZN3 domain-containing protein [Treponema primitia]AEF85614.1 type IV pilus assembly protein PilZ [Treponema primitia ZAS-2]
MSVLTSQKIASYYERYKEIDVTFTKEIIQVTGLITQQVLLKCVGDFWPCVIYSSSFQGAKVVANIKSGLTEKLQQANNSVSLRLCFKSADSASPVTFFVTARVAGYSPYGGSSDTALFTLLFTQRPPDDLIEIMGRILDANINSTKRKDERVLLTADSIRKLKVMSKDTAAFIEKVPRRCILRDLSFSGAKIIMMGVAKFLVDRETALRLDFEDPRESFLVRGKFIRAETVEGRKELIALAITFDEGVIPMGYKVRLNDFLSVVRADNRGDAAQAQDEHNQAEAAISKLKEDSAKAKAEKNAAPEAPAEDAVIK